MQQKKVSLRIVCLLTFKEVIKIDPCQKMIRLNKELSNLIGKYMDMRTRKFGLTGIQGVALMYVCENGGLNTGKLIEFMDTSKSTVSAILKRLYAKGFIALETLEGDSRCKKVVPTQKAMRVKSALSNEFTDIAAQLYGDVPPDKLAAALEFQQLAVSRARAALKSYNDKEE